MNALHPAALGSLGERQQFIRHGEAERFGGGQIDDEIEFDRLLDGNIGRLTYEPADLYLGITRSVMCRGSFTPWYNGPISPGRCICRANPRNTGWGMDMVGFVSTFPYAFYMGPALIVLLAFSLLVLAAATHSLGQVRAGK